MSNYFLRIAAIEGSPQLWRIDEDEAVLQGVTDPQGGGGTYFRRGEHKTIWHAIHAGASSWLDPEDLSASPFHRLDLAPTHCYPRMARPLRMAMPISPSWRADSNVVATNIGQAKTLMHRLQTICQTVQPTTANLGAYGHEIRNLLILAAMEVETHWRGVLVANGFTRDRPWTSDYVKLLVPMRLDQYAVGFRHYPWMDPVRPFGGWSADQPTQSLFWYDAYNGVKHNREHEFHRADLASVFAAVSACVVMLAAQFTASIGLGGRSELSDFFTFVEVPEWEPRESYVDYFDPTGSTGERAPHEWTTVRYPGIA